jgi:dCMP deaminase
MTLQWDRRYLDLAEFWANKCSKDPSTKVGAVLVNWQENKEFLGYNGFPRKVNDNPERYNNRDLKLKMVVHAEVNAILKAGDYARGSTLYVFPSFSNPPICNECVKLAIQQGVKEIVGYEIEPNDKARAARWKESIDIARQMCDEAGVKYRVIPKETFCEVNQCFSFVSPGIPSWAKPLPKKLDIGKKVMIKSGHTWMGWIGIVKKHYINTDDCGDYGAHTYEVERIDGQRFHVRPEYCKIIE